MGPTIFGRFLPDFYNIIFPHDPVQQNMLELVAWMGLMFFLLETGLKMDFSSAWRHRGEALFIALTDIAVPMTISFALCLFIPSCYLINPDQRIVFSFFMATVMTVSAMPVTMRALHDLDMAKTDLGFLIMSALSVNEIIGWVIFAFVLQFLSPVANFEIIGIIAAFAFIIILIIICFTFGRRFADYIVTKIKEYDLPEPGSSLAFICLLGAFFGAVFQKMGINALMGFFIAGIVAGEARALPERTRQVISQMVYALFVPIFFASIGLRVDFLKNFNLFLVLFVTVVGFFGKFFGAWLGCVFTKIPKENKTPVAIAHTPGGSMEIVIGILALQYGLISESIFVAIVCGGVVSSVVLGPWLKYVVNKRKEFSALEFFSKHAVISDIKSNDKNGAIHELCSLISEQGNTPRLETLYSAVHHRENDIGTAIGKGIAIPHARLSSLVKPIIAFGRSTAGIEWDTPDGKPAQFIFLILSTKEDDWAQIQILRIIAKAMSDKKTRELILKAPDTNNLWHLLEHAFTQHIVTRKH